MSDVRVDPDASAPQLPVGIDFGTTTSALAYIDASGRLVDLRGADGHPLIVPSAICFGDRMTVGSSAEEQSVESPDLYVEGFKREMGKAHFHRKIRQRGVPPEVLCAFVLEHLKAEAEKVLGPVRQAVITVPAYYDEPRRKATHEAGRLAGLDVLDIINEPTAAAVAVGYQDRLQAAGSEAPRRILVYDLGGGTFDVSVLQIEGRKFTTLATDGDIQLGGRDFDQRLVDHLAQRFVEAHGADPRSHPADLQHLWQVAKSAKHELSTKTSCVAVCHHAGLRLGIELDRAEFEELIDPFVERTLNTCLDVVHEAGLKWESIGRILLVGGSTRIPFVSRRLRELTGLAPTSHETPELLVSQGAALHAAMCLDRTLLDESTVFNIVNVNAHSLGIAGIDPTTLEPLNTILIPRNTPLPAYKKHRYVTRRDNQRSVSVKVLEGESENPKFCTAIGKCVVKLEPGLPAGTDVEVSCNYRANGLIFVSARIPRTKTSAHIELRRDQENVLESLIDWRKRLTLGEEPAATPTADVPVPEPPDTPLADTGDVNQVLERLDFLYVQVGKSVLPKAVPAEALAAQRAARGALRELAAVRQLVDNIARSMVAVADLHERKQISVLESQAQSYCRQAESFAAHALVTLGRICADLDFCPEQAASHGQEIRSILPAVERLA